MSGIYDKFKDACASHGTTITQVLNAIGKSDGSTGTWKAGKYPRLDTAMEIAKHLHISLDELCYGYDGMSAKLLTENDREWLYIISRIPADKQELCKDFLRTHMTVPEKYVDKRDA